ncbi:hypothetical protein ACOMHN_062558 [Nucella lapillus]
MCNSKDDYISVRCSDHHPLESLTHAVLCMQQQSSISFFLCAGLQLRNVDLRRCEHIAVACADDDFPRDIGLCKNVTKKRKELFLILVKPKETLPVSRYESFTHNSSSLA